MIRVLVVDDHTVVRSGLRLLLDTEPDIETVGEAPNADRAVFEAIELKPDVVLMDLVMPEKGGIEGMPAVLKAVPTAKVLVLSMQDEPRYVRAAFAAGASGYVLKEAAEAELVAAIREVAKGGRYVHPTLGARLIEAEASRATPRRGGSALRPGARGAEAARARPDEPGDRRAAVHLSPDGGDAPSAHHAEAPAGESGRSRSLRPGTGAPHGGACALVRRCDCSEQWGSRVIAWNRAVRFGRPANVSVASNG